jgi:hypothetical protein
MKSVAAGTTSGCVLWVITFCVLSSCLFPMATFVGGFSTTLTADFVADTVGPFLCPEGSTAEIITFQTTTTDEYGTEHPATGYEMQCVDSSGTIVREPSPDYAFYWIGLLSAGSFILAAVLALLFAAPIGGFVMYLGRRLRSTPAASPG